MEKTIEKYVYAVVKRLPTEKRDEVSKELKANIYDLLGEDTSDKKLDQVLHDLGHPMIVASKYQENPKYVVNPVHYEDYKNILAIAMIGGAILGLVIALISGFTSPQMHQDFGDLIGSIIDDAVDNMFGYAASAFMIVTIVFWYLNTKHGQSKMDNYLNHWKTKDLNSVPKDGKKEKHSNRIVILIEAIFALLIQALLISAFIVYYDNIAVYLNGTKEAQVFSTTIKPLLIGTGFTGLGFSALYYMSYVFSGRKSLLVVSLRTVDTFVSVLLMIIILTRTDLFHADFINYMSNLFNTSLDTIKTNTTYVLNAIMVVVILANAAETYSNWRSYFKNR